MDRHFVRIDGEECLIEGGDGPVSIGSVDAIVEALGGEEYVLQYDEEAASTPWLTTDDDGTVTVTVRTAIEDLPLPPGVYEELSTRSRTSDEGPSERVRYFVAVVETIWDAKGSVEPNDLADVELE